MSQSSRHWIYVLLFLLFSGFLSYKGWDGHFGSALTRVILALMLPYILFKYNSFPHTPIMRLAFLLMCVPFLSIFSCYIAHGQSMLDTFIVTFHMCGYLILPLMYLLKVEEKWLLRFCFLIGIFWAIVPLVQQFTWPTYWFATRGENEETGEPEMRNGIIRYAVAGTTQGLIMLFYALQSYLETNKRKWLVWMLVGLVGVYMTCTRQVMAASIGCIFVGLFIKGKIRIGALVGFLVVGLIIYFNADALLGEYIEMTERDTSNDEYVRILAYRFYGWEYSDGDPLLLLLGNGIARQEHNLAFAKDLEHAAFELGFYYVDVGWAGLFFLYGAVFIAAMLAFYWYVFRNRKDIPLYLLLYVLYMFVTQIMLFHFDRGVAFGIVTVMYLMDLSIRRSRELSAQSAPAEQAEEEAQEVVAETS